MADRMGGPGGPGARAERSAHPAATPPLRALAALGRCSRAVRPRWVNAWRRIIVTPRSGWVYGLSLPTTRVLTRTRQSQNVRATGGRSASLTAQIICNLAL